MVTTWSQRNRGARAGQERLGRKCPEPPSKNGRLLAIAPPDPQPTMPIRGGYPLPTPASRQWPKANSQAVSRFFGRNPCTGLAVRVCITWESGSSTCACLWCETGLLLRSERRPKSETRKGNLLHPRAWARDPADSGSISVGREAFRTSAFFRPSGFGFRIWGPGASWRCRDGPYARGWARTELTSWRALAILLAWQSQLWAVAWGRCWATARLLSRQGRRQSQP